jgi:hypothetical protein
MCVRTIHSTPRHVVSQPPPRTSHSDPFRPPQLIYRPLVQHCHRSFCEWPKIGAEERAAEIHLLPLVITMRYLTNTHGNLVANVMPARAGCAYHLWADAYLYLHPS